MNINLHIERLVLEGISVDSHQRPMLKATIETELRRLLTQHGIASDFKSRAAVNIIRTDSIEVGEKDEPSHLGRQLAQSVYGYVSR